MTRLALLTAAALVAFSAVASAQTATARGDKYAIAQQGSQTFTYQAAPLILGVAY